MVEKRELNVRLKRERFRSIRQQMEEDLTKKGRKRKRKRNVDRNTTQGRIRMSNEILNDPDLSDAQKERLITKTLKVPTKLRKER